MAVKTTLLKGRVALLALAAASLAVPAAASAQDQDRQERGRWGQRAERAQSDNGNNGGERRSWGSRSDENRSGGGGQSAAWGDRNEQSRGNGGEARAWGRGGGNADTNAQQSPRGYAGRGPGAWQQSAPAAAPADNRQVQRSTLPGPWGRAQDNARRDNERGGSWSGRDNDRGRNTTYTNRDGNGSLDNNRYRDANRDRDGNWNRDDNRYRDGNNTRYSEQWRNDRSRSGSYYSNNNNRYRQGLNGNFSNWDRRWRDNNRYNWYSYRRTNPSIYRWGTYYSPYRNYSYRRLSIGFTLDSLFYGSRYWINDPWQYRLPDVYGPYRWVRYYDDALLVNVYDGEVVDVIYDFFW